VGPAGTIHRSTAHSESQEARAAAGASFWSARAEQRAPAASAAALILPGATLVFPTSTPHFGVRNPASVDRVALYALFSPSDESGQDDTQRFPLGVTDD